MSFASVEHRDHLRGPRRQTIADLVRCISLLDGPVILAGSSAAEFFGRFHACPRAPSRDSTGRPTSREVSDFPDRRVEHEERFLGYDKWRPPTGVPAVEELPASVPCLVNNEKYV
jgi:hypothetical protein